MSILRVQQNGELLMKIEMKDVFIVSGFLGLFYVSHQNNKSLEARVDTVRQENSFNEGIGFYMPGSSCVIKATPDVGIQKFKDMMSVCAARHLQYLESQKRSDDDN